MGLETGTYISDFVLTNPTGADDRSTSDDHHRLIKAFVQQTFPNLNGAVTGTPADLNKLAGFTGTQADLNKLPAIVGTGKIDALDTGTIVTFQMTTAPTGWTKLTTHNNKSLRVVSGTAGSGGSNAFTTVFGAGKNTASYTLLTADVPAHTPTVNISRGSSSYSNSSSIIMMSSSSVGSGSLSGSSVGGGGGHLHGITNMNLQYVDLILASKA